MGRRPKNLDNDTYNPTNVLTFLRTRKGLTMAELAEQTNLTTNDICRFEVNHHNLGVGKLRQLANFFNVKMAVLWENDLYSLGELLKSPVQKSNKMREQIHRHQEICEHIGDEGEAWVFELERQRLAGTPYENLINPNFANEEQAHFDLLSFSPDTGEPIRIEVKSTTGDATDPMYMSVQEWGVLLHCLKHNQRYELHRVYHCDDEHLRQREIFTAEEVLSAFTVVPNSYKLVPKEV